MTLYRGGNGVVNPTTWLTQRLLSFITLLDTELTRTLNALKRALPHSEQAQESFRR